jgi:hypothetical protein
MKVVNDCLRHILLTHILQGVHEHDAKNTYRN